jgi:hypothetical protein
MNAIRARCLFLVMFLTVSAVKMQAVNVKSISIIIIARHEWNIRKKMPNNVPACRLYGKIRKYLYKEGFILNVFGKLIAKLCILR